MAPMPTTPLCPTDALATFSRVMGEMEGIGFEKLKAQQQQLGDKVRALLESKGVKSVAAPGFQAPGVIVSYTDDSDIQSGLKFKQAGLPNRGGGAFAMR